jgi:NTP pyrophosphatase (non-canonical NTP hydrolase)
MITLKEAQSLVEEFHRKYGAPRSMLWNVQDKEAWLHVGHQRNRLIMEEFFEMISAWHEKDIVELADGLTDLLYVVLGTAVAAGIDLAPLFEAVHASNMSKDVGEFKPIKGPNFFKPDVRGLLLKQGFSIKDL